LKEIGLEEKWRFRMENRLATYLDQENDDVQLVKINVACCNQYLNNMNSYTDNRGIFYWCKNCEHSFYLDEI